MGFLKIFALLVISFSLYAEENEIDSLYSLNNISGSILIESADGNIKYQHNVDDKEAFIPASTFKIPNTLIMRPQHNSARQGIFW